MKRGKVIKKEFSGNISKDVEEIVNELGGIEKYVKKGEKVLIKPSCNSPDNFPAVTDIKVIEKIVQLVKKQTNPKKITIGESSGVLYKPTGKVFRKMGLYKLSKKEKVNLADFDKNGWVEKRKNKAKYLKKVRLTKMLEEFDRIIFLPTMRSHRGSRFTMSLKLGMGFIHIKDRLEMHQDKLEEKLAEMNLYFKPDLIIMDGRKTFITDGPERGKVRKPGILFGSTSRLNIDIEGLKVLKQYKQLTKRLDMPINQIPLIKHSKKIGIE